MKLLVIGSGGREHAICYKFAQSDRVAKLFCAPGNAGISLIAECVPIKAEEITALADFAEQNAIDLTFVGGESSLALGVTDEFQRRGLKIIGASQAAARLESSKAFAKDFMSRHGIPTARYYTANSPAEAIETLESGHFGPAAAPVVVKADGLAAGKGVVVARDRAEAIAACTELAAIVGDTAAERIVLEEFLDGREVSLLMFVDGKDFVLMPPVRDHKRVDEGDTGPNTGGMGTITEDSLLMPEGMQTIISEIIEPTLKGCMDEGFPFRGILFLGLMMTSEAASPQIRSDEEQQTYVTAAPKVLEYNVRFGDPETQSILVRLETDLVDICEAILSSHLGQVDVKWSDGSSACVVLAAEGYPQKPRTGDVINGLGEASALENVTIFHAGTAVDQEGNQQEVLATAAPAASSFIPHPSSFLTAGGRVLGITATGASLDEALSTAYTAAGLISWPGLHYRRDIGR